jgi:hypothetical protein
MSTKYICHLICLDLCGWASRLCASVLRNAPVGARRTDANEKPDRESKPCFAGADVIVHRDELPQLEHLQGGLLFIPQSSWLQIGIQG